jgi:hypothetical protein
MVIFIVRYQLQRKTGSALLLLFQFYLPGNIYKIEHDRCCLGLIQQICERAFDPKITPVIMPGAEP